VAAKPRRETPRNAFSGRFPSPAPTVSRIRPPGALGSRSGFPLRSVWGRG